MDLGLPISRYLVVGSYALCVRPANDIDVICYFDDILVETTGDEYLRVFHHNGWRIECLLADKQESLQTFLWATERKGNPLAPISMTFAKTIDVCYALKAGHITIPGKNWEKHIADYHILRKMCAQKLDTWWMKDLIKLHKKSTEERIGKQKTPKLIGVSKEKFFDDKVVKYMEHDEIHQKVAHREKPMYSYMQQDESSVECDKSLWETFTEDDKIKCVLEECYVISLERHIIPTMYGDRIGLNYHDAFKWALMRVCTTLCSGWFRQFAIDHYFEILNSYNREYFKLL